MAYTELQAKTSATKDKLSKTIVLVEFGGYDKLRTWQRQIQEPKEGEVIVEVKACGLNFAEVSARQGLYQKLPQLPMVLGLECSGTIAKLGPGVTEPKVGTRVVCLKDWGLWTEYATIPARNCFPIPDEMTFEEAAAIPVNYITAYLMLFDFGNLRPGKSVLIHMAAGGVGFAAAQLCKTVPKVTTFGTASRHKHEAIMENGITHPIDYRTKDYKEEILKISPKGIDIVLDPLNGYDTTKGYQLLKPMGRIIVFGGANFVIGEHRSLWNLFKNWWNVPTYNGMKMMVDNKAVCGFHLGMLTDNYELIMEAMNALIEMYNEGKIKPKIDSIFPFEKIGDAMKRIHDRQNVGKIILVPELPPETAEPVTSEEETKDEQTTDKETEDEKAEEEKEN
ncbi:synaptic vesicle membrane protein VAT-1 homolog [Ptychodera flava]|uniref:synaptic vesicle membrane protein VAT-1 homolog n=1 Tax=Ptychodera flava TaxID=63121 RepID=UPI00396A9D3D